jgi:hypothetical protein
MNITFGGGRTLNTYREPNDKPNKLENQLNIPDNEIKGGGLIKSPSTNEIKGGGLIKSPSTNEIKGGGGLIKSPSPSTNEIKGAITTEDLIQIKKNNRRAEIETGFIALTFGVSFAYVLVYVSIIFGFLFKAFVLFIIFNICVIIYKTIQFGLDISLKIVGGIGDTMQKTVDGAVIKGFKIMGIKVPEVRLLSFLQGPTNKVKDAKNKIPKEAWNVILEIIKEFFNTLLN